jgi:hypothetical protein
VAALVVTQELLDRTFDTFRGCGRAELECVVYWTGPQGDASIVDGLDHPDHESNEFGYSVDPDWLTKFFHDLYRERRAARTQIHTHPGAAFHSVTDDKHSLVPAPGFISIVIPDFAQGRVGFERAAAYCMGDSGTWVEWDVGDVEVR